MAHLIPTEMLKFYRALGIFPVKNIGSERIENMKRCPFILLYSLMFVASHTCLSFYSMIGKVSVFQDALSVFNRMNDKVVSNTTKIVSCFDIFSLSVSAIAYVLAAGKNCPQVIELYSELKHWDSLLKVKSLPSNMKLRMILYLIFFTVLITFDASVRYLTIGLTVPQMSVFLLHYTDLAVQLQFLGVVDCIHQRFRLVNQRITLEVTRHRFQGVLKLPPVEQISDIIRTSPVAINSLSDLHWILCGIVHKTNALFSCQLLFHMLFLFLHIIITPYFFFFSINFYAQENLIHISLITLIVQLFWVISHSMKLILLVWPCAETTQEANQTAPIVCKLLNREMSPDMRKQLETFVLQLLHHNSEFSAFGLFSLQCPILTSIAGAVTTYLVILIQFDNADVPDIN